MVSPNPSGSLLGRTPGMEPRDVGTTRGSGGNGSGSDGSEGRSVYASSLLRRLMLSPPTSTHLMSEFNAAADGEGPGSVSSSSSSSSGVLDLGPDESHYRRRVDPEASPTPNHVGCLLLLSPVGSPPRTDDDVLIMDGVLVDSNDESDTPSRARGSASLVDSNGPGNRRSVSLSDLVLVSSRSTGSRGGGSSSNDQERGGPHRTPQIRRQNQGEEGSPRSRRRWRELQGAGHPNNTQQGQGQARPMGYVNFPPPLAGPHVPDFAFGVAAGYYPPLLPPYYMPPPPPVFTPPIVSMPWPPVPYAPRPRVIITRPPGWPAGPSAPPAHQEPEAAPGRRSRVVTITAPPDRPAGPSAPTPEQPATQAPAPPVQEPEAAPGRRSRVVTIIAPPDRPAGPPAPEPEPPATQAPAPAPAPTQASSEPTFSWPPTPEQDAAITEKLYGPSTGRRLPVFRDICPDDGPGPSPSPPPPPPRAVSGDDVDPRSDPPRPAHPSCP